MVTLRRARYAFTAALLLVAVTSAHGQNARIRGTVAVAGTSERLAGATVHLQGSDRSWAVFGARAEPLVPRFRSTVFLEEHNLTDQRYLPSVQVAAATGRFSNPAHGRSLNVGAHWRP